MTTKKPRRTPASKSLSVGGVIKNAQTPVIIGASALASNLYVAPLVNSVVARIMPDSAAATPAVSGLAGTAKNFVPGVVLIVGGVALRQLVKNPMLKSMMDGMAVGGAMQLGEKVISSTPVATVAGLNGRGGVGRLGNPVRRAIIPATRMQTLPIKQSR